MATGYDRRGKPRRPIEQAFSLSVRGKKSELPDRIGMLGIPEDELSESVTLALSALFERLDDTNLELRQTQDKLKEIESLVDVDFLAPIPNRRAFMRRLSWVISMLNRYGHPSSIVYFDLNGFKAINDTYGHAAGDMVIRHVAETLTKIKRETDFMARMGGDEFAIIMYYAEEDAAKRRGTEIADKIRALSINFNGQPLKINTAVGFHALKKGETAENALHAADQSMYANKKQLRQLAQFNA